MVTFNSVPADSRVPFIYLEIDGAQAQQGASVQPYEILVLGLRKATGSVAEKTPTLVTNEAQASEFFGAGSMLHGMARGLFAVNKNTKATFVALDETGANATGTITLTAAPTADGALSIYVAGELIAVPVSSSDTITTLASAIADAVNAKTHLPVTALSAVGVVTLTAGQKGTEGNSIDVRMNRFAGEATPAGLMVTIAAVGTVVPGTGSPTIDATLWSQLGETHYNVLAVGFDPGVSETLTALEAEMDDRGGPTRAIEGLACFWARDSHSNLITLGDGENAKYLSIMAISAASLSTSWQSAATYAGALAREAKIDPARPFQTIELTGLVAPDASELFTHDERNLLLHDGIATATTNASGLITIERAITLYQENAGGADDTAFLDATTIFTLSFLRWDTRTRFATRYPRHKLAADGTRFGPGQAVLTPSLIKAELLGYFLAWEAQGLVEGFAQFKSELIVEISATDPNRIDVVMPPNLINQLRVVGAAIRFIL